MVKLFNIVVPATFNELLKVVEPFNVVFPKSFNELLIVLLLFNVVNPDILYLMKMHMLKRY